MIAVVNLGISNLTSVLNALKYLGLDFYVADKPEELSNASHIILPGVGTFGEGMKRLNNKGFTEALNIEVLTNKKPLLGICLGMQLLFQSSEESPDAIGLSLVKGKVVRLEKSAKYTIPRIGWAESVFKSNFLGIDAGKKLDFYYIHSFCCQPENQDIITITDETSKITAAIQDNNIMGCQFHPEKSHKTGLILLKQFAEYKN